MLLQPTTKRGSLSKAAYYLQCLGLDARVAGDYSHSRGHTFLLVYDKGVIYCIADDLAEHLFVDRDFWRAQCKLNDWVTRQWLHMRDTNDKNGDCPPETRASQDDGIRDCPGQLYFAGWLEGPEYPKPYAANTSLSREGDSRRCRL